MIYRKIFYIPKWGDWKIVDNIISLVTLLYNWRSPAAAHVEDWFPTTTGRFHTPCSCYDKPDGCTDCDLKGVSGYLGQMFTSTMRGKDNGTVMRPASRILKHPERWFYYEIECDPEDFKIAMTWAKYECKTNEGYAMRTLGKFVGIKWIDKARNICSQVSYKFSMLTKTLPQPAKIPSPRKLAKMMEELGYEKHYLVERKSK